jgi:hypothetical protein
MREPLTEGVTLFERLYDTDIVGVAVDEQDMNNGLQDRVADDDGALLRDTLVLTVGDCGNPDCVALLEILCAILVETLGEARTESDGVILNPKELLRVGLARFDGDIVVDLEVLLDKVIEILLEGVGVDEHDMKSGLHDRVADDDGALLRDTLVLREGDNGIPKRLLLTDILRDCVKDTDKLRVIDIDLDTLAEYEGDTDTVAVILRKLVRDIDTDGVAVDEQDMKSGLHDRVADEDGGLLRDTL